MAMVEVVTSDGHMELWPAALPLSGAVAAIQDVIPADCIATLSDRRLLITHPYGGFGTAKFEGSSRAVRLKPLL